ncbi:BnaC09g51770D [Brassica napus]|uniref:BnaC09g51770D protein n=1 Tax=Brassica napus TaxID=3708 RepID=A0A078J2E8_BRANA|nr:BnaC09g51770D [Brassica napus]
MAQGRLCNRDGLILTAMVSYPCAVLVYSYGFGSLLLLPPLVFFSFRSRSLPPLTSLILYKMGLLGLIVSAAQIAGNVNPAFTFIFAVIFRMEKLAIRKEKHVHQSHIGLLEVAFLLFRTFFTPSLTLLWHT